MKIQELLRIFRSKLFDLFASSLEFVAVNPNKKFTLPAIILPYDEITQTGFNWAMLGEAEFAPHVNTPEARMQHTVHYLREAILKMTGQELPVESRNDLSQGIVLTLLENAARDIQNDPKVIQALRNTGEDGYNATEAFFVRTDRARVLLVANTVDGLCNAVVELLESVSYEVLGMGPNWTHIPDYYRKPLVFKMERAGRPGFYIRSLWATSGQERGVGSLTAVTVPGDLSVHDSYRHWLIGTRMIGHSMPLFPGHALQSFHKAVLEQMRETRTTQGFLTHKTSLGLDAHRPTASDQNKGELWINIDATGQSEAGKSLISDGTKWIVQNIHQIGVALDLSVPLVRNTIMNSIKVLAQAHFEKEPNELLIIGTDPEDGGGYNLLDKLAYPNWYPDYLMSEGIRFGQPYILHGFKGLNQLYELWDSKAASDTVFGFNNWLLQEFDKWIDSHPAAERVTASGKSKKKLIRTSLYSYNYHDVPSNFNLDPRIRVMIAGYPKHRGWGKWKNFKTHIDMAEAFRVMLSHDPGADYWILSLSYFQDHTTNGVRGSHLPKAIQHNIAQGYEAGVRALSVETDFNFGKQGLEYYLYSKMLWNPNLTVSELTGIRDRWLQRAFGNGWKEMQKYYQFMAPENYLINAPNNWAKAIRFIDAADKRMNGTKEPEAQRRLDDLKQYWYFYYLLETSQNNPITRDFKEFVWKAQMSYMTAMHMVTRRFFNTNSAKDAAGEEFNKGPAHYTHAETQAWWAKVLNHWQVTPVSEFVEATLADGTKGRAVDLNDAVRVAEFETVPADAPFLYNAASSHNEIPFLTTAKQAGDEIGFKLFWPSSDTVFYRGRDVFYGISRWDPQRKEWDTLVDKTMISIHSQLTIDRDGKEFQLAEARYKAPQPGTYRIEVVNGGDSSRLTTLDYDLQSGVYAGSRGHTYLGNLSGQTQVFGRYVYFYIPKGTKSLDMEVWDAYENKKLQLYKGLPTSDLTKTREIDVKRRGTHIVKLEPGEDGSIAMLWGNGFAFPYLYSVPIMWARSPAALMVPRAIARADGLTILN